MAIGFLLDFTPAMLICWGVNVLAVMASFYMVRSAFTEYFTRKYGLWSVVFSRAIYIIPTNLINFSFPLSKISTRSYLAGTMIGLIPE